MADAKLSDLVALASADLATGDLLYIVDVTEAGAGSKKITAANFRIGIESASTRWEDLRVALNSTRLGGSKDPGYTKLLDNGSSSQGVFCYKFDKAAEEELYFSAQMPHAMKLNSDIHPHIHWCPTANGGEGHTVSWGLEYTWQDIGGVFANTAIIYTDTHIPADATLVANKHYISSFDAISGAVLGASVSSILMCRIFRDAGGTGGTDSYDNDAAALYFDFHVECDTTGSLTELAKWGS